MTVSVVIATYNRAALLADCLACLARQPFAAGDEVIVIDNGSTDETPDAIERARRLFAVPVHHLEERSPGKSRAIARGLDAASGEVLAFTDDDVEVGAGWLDAIRGAMRDPEVGLAGGPVAPRWQALPPRWLRAAVDTVGPLAAPLALLDYGPASAELGDRTAIGANMAVRRAVFQQVGGFAPHLGKLRGTLLSGEDRELCRQVQAAGWRAVYAPDARVRHWVPADRMRFGYYISWFFWSGITHATLDAERPSTAATVLGVPRYLVRRAAAGSVGALFHAASGHLATSVERAMDVAFAAGYASRAWRMRASSRVGLESGTRAAAAGRRASESGS